MNLNLMMKKITVVFCSLAMMTASFTPNVIFKGNNGISLTVKVNAEEISENTLPAPEGLSHNPSADGSHPYYFSWAEVEDADGYNVYKDGKYVATTTSAGYNFDKSEFTTTGEYQISVAAIGTFGEGAKASIIFTVSDETTSENVSTEPPIESETVDKAETTYEITESPLNMTTEESTTSTVEESTTSTVEESATSTVEESATLIPKETKPITTVQKTTTSVEKSTISKGLAKSVINSAIRKKASKKVKISFKKITGATKYQVQISAKKNFKKVLVGKTVKKYRKIITINNKKLKNKNKLFVRVRAVDGKVNGVWSTPKKVNTK